MNGVNLKKIIIEHFDELINQIDIHTEEQLEKYSSTDTVQVPNEPDDAKSMLVWNYLNTSRDEMIEYVRKAQDEALKLVEIIRNNSKMTLESNDDQVMRKFLLRMIRPPIILCMNETKRETYKPKVENPSPFKIYLINFEINIDISQNFLLILRYLYLSTTNSMFRNVIS